MSQRTSSMATNNDLRSAEEGRKSSKDPDQHSDTEGTTEDHLSPVAASSARNRLVCCFAVFLCTVFLTGVGVALGLLIPEFLEDNSDDVSTSSSRSTTKQSNSTTNLTEIAYEYISINASESRDGGFYSDARGQALNDSFTDVLQGGKVLAWPQTPEPADSTHRVVFELKEPQPVNQVNVTGIVLERWGLNAPVSLRLQLGDSRGTTFSDTVLYLKRPNDEGSWYVTFAPATKDRNVTEAWLDVTCPLSAATIDSLNMKCGISEVDFF